MYLQVRKSTRGVIETGELMRSLAVAYSGDVSQYMSMSVPAFYRKVRDIPYRFDPKEMEFLQRPAQTLAGRGPGGDCDDKAIAMAAFLHRKEIPFRFLGAARLKENPLHHTWVQGYINGEWVDFDTTYAWNSAGSRVGSWEKEIVINKENDMMVGILYGENETFLGRGFASRAVRSAKRVRMKAKRLRRLTRKLSPSHFALRQAKGALQGDTFLGEDDTFLGRAGFLRRATRKATKTFKKISPAHIAYRVGKRTVRGIGHGIAVAGRGTGHVIGNVGRGVGSFTLRGVKVLAPVAAAYLNRGGGVLSPAGYTGGPDTGLSSIIDKVMDAVSPEKKDMLPQSMTQPERAEAEMKRAGMSLPIVLGIVGVGAVAMMMLKKKRG